MVGSFQNFPKSNNSKYENIRDIPRKIARMRIKISRGATFWTKIAFTLWTQELYLENSLILSFLFGKSAIGLREIRQIFFCNMEIISYDSSSNRISKNTK